MITALQGAKLEAANKLKAVHDLLWDLPSLICWQGKEGDQINDLLQRVDALFVKVVSNEPAKK